MTQTTQMQASQAMKRPQRGVWQVISALCSAVVWGLLIGLAINGVLWYHEGYAVLLRNVQTTYQTQLENVNLHSPRIAAQAAQWMGKAHSIMLAGEQRSREWLTLEANQHHVHPSRSALTKGQVSLRFIGHLLIITGLTLKVIIAKCVSIITAFWVFLFAGLLGALDGLLARYIRTHEGGRESTFVFHRISNLMIKLPIGIVFLYLTSPLFINPDAVIVVMSLLFFSFFAIATANLKKFL